MKIPTKTRYAVLAVLDLTLHSGEGLIQLKDIAARQGISERYLEQLMIPLRQAGLILSSRGSRGGHELAKHPSEITLADVAVATGGMLTFAECLGTPSACERASSCAVRRAWGQAVEAYRASLSSISFQMLAEEQMHMISEKTSMYYI